MPCTSLRSGMASSGVLFSAQMPPAMPKTARMIMRKALRELASMMRSMRKEEGGALERWSVGASEREASGAGVFGESVDMMSCQERLERAERLRYETLARGAGGTSGASGAGGESGA